MSAWIVPLASSSEAYRSGAAEMSCALASVSESGLPTVPQADTMSWPTAQPEFDDTKKPSATQGPGVHLVSPLISRPPAPTYPTPCESSPTSATAGFPSYRTVSPAQCDRVLQRPWQWPRRYICSCRALVVVVVSLVFLDAVN